MTFQPNWRRIEDRAALPAAGEQLRHLAVGFSRPAPKAGPAVRSARAAVSGHFGELMQGRLGANGPLALVTLPAPPLRARADLRPGPFGVHCAGGQVLDRRQVVALHRAVAGGPPRGRLVLRVGMPPGGGAGSSTAALLAVAAVYAAAHGRDPGMPEALARLCVGLEGATDPLMYPGPARLLWAPRDARVLARLPALPALEVVGGFLGRGLRTDPADLDFADISDLVAAWVPAAARGDLAALARLATESACRNAARRGGPSLEPVFGVAARFGALGIVAAHTGSARGLIFAAGDGGNAAIPDALRKAGLRGLCRFRVGGDPCAG